MPRQCKWIEGDQCTNSCLRGEEWCKLHYDTVKWTQNMIDEKTRLTTERDSLHALKEALKENIEIKEQRIEMLNVCLNSTDRLKTSYKNDNYALKFENKRLKRDVQLWKASAHFWKSRSLTR